MVDVFAPARTCGAHERPPPQTWTRALPPPDRARASVRCYPAVRDLIWGRAPELPLNMVVKPNVLPEPLERMVST